MGFQINGTDVKDVLLNGAQVQIVQLNGVEVWRRMREFEAIFPGLDNNTGTATLQLTRVGGTLNIEKVLFGRNANGQSVNTKSVVGQIVFDTNSPLPVYDVQVTNVVQSGEPNAVVTNSATARTQVQNTPVFVFTSSRATNLYSVVTFVVTVRNASTNAIVESANIQFTVMYSN